MLPGRMLAVEGEMVTPLGSGPKVIAIGVAKVVTLVVAVMPITTLEFASKVSGALGVVNWLNAKGGAPW